MGLRGHMALSERTRFVAQGWEDRDAWSRRVGLRLAIALSVATAAVLVVGSAAATTLPVQVKMTVVSKRCRFSMIVAARQMQSALARRCSGTDVAHVRLPKLLEGVVVIRRGTSWVIRLQELP
jgi:hypothetical protein